MTIARIGTLLIGASSTPPVVARSALSRVFKKVPEPTPSIRTHTAFVESAPLIERSSGATRFAISNAMLAESLAESAAWPAADVDAAQIASNRTAIRVALRIRVVWLTPEVKLRANRIKCERSELP
jgi:hypothetical protein